MDYKKIFTELFSITTRAVSELREYCDNEKDFAKARVLNSIKSNLDQIADVHKKRDFELDTAKQKFEELYSEIRHQAEIIENLKSDKLTYQVKAEEQSKVVAFIFTSNPMLAEKIPREQLESLLGKEKTNQLKSFKYNPYKRVA